MYPPNKDCTLALRSVQWIFRLPVPDTAYALFDTGSAHSGAHNTKTDVVPRAAGAAFDGTWVTVGHLAEGHS
ncbi:hypothetical protein AGMMS50268_06800 [Spirochaetia bacterium]|nr:hypothetical protein AGMMS50268_06800 [Spirochaetia bacterium]